MMTADQWPSEERQPIEDAMLAYVGASGQDPASLFFTLRRNRRGKIVAVDMFSAAGWQLATYYCRGGSLGQGRIAIDPAQASE